MDFFTVIFDRSRQITGQDLRTVMIECCCSALFGIADTAENIPANNTESVSNDGVAVYSRPSLGTALVGVGIGAFIALIGFVIGRKGGKEE